MASKDGETQQKKKSVESSDFLIYISHQTDN